MSRTLARCLSLLLRCSPLSAGAQERLVDVQVVDLDQGNCCHRIPHAGRDYVEGRPGHRLRRGPAQPDRRTRDRGGVGRWRQRDQRPDRRRPQGATCSSPGSASKIRGWRKSLLRRRRVLFHRPARFLRRAYRTPGQCRRDRRRRLSRAPPATDALPAAGGGAAALRAALPRRAFSRLALWRPRRPRREVGGAARPIRPPRSAGLRKERSRRTRPRRCRRRSAPAMANVATTR